MPFDFPPSPAFPANPTEGQIFTPPGGPTYVFRSPVWRTATPGQALTALPRNRFTNGAMQISQENGNTASPAAAAGTWYAADQWLAAWQLTGTAYAWRAATAAASSGYMIRLTIGTATPSLAAGAYIQYVQNIEGTRLADFKWGTVSAKRAVLRFMAHATVAGTYCVTIRNAVADRSFLAPFTLVANTWTTITIAVLGDITGTWPTDNTTGMSVGFGLATGATYGGGVAGWQAGNKLQIAGNTNGAATAGAIFSFADVGLYLDPDNTGKPPPWEMRDEAEELQACQRYWWRTGNVVQTMARAYDVANGLGVNVYHPTPMRIPPAASTSAVTVDHTATPSAPNSDTTRTAIVVRRTASDMVYGVFHLVCNARM